MVRSHSIRVAAFYYALRGGVPFGVMGNHISKCSNNGVYYCQSGNTSQEIR